MVQYQEVRRYEDIEEKRDEKECKFTPGFERVYHDTQARRRTALCSMLVLAALTYALARALLPGTVSIWQSCRGHASAPVEPDFCQQQPPWTAPSSLAHLLPPASPRDDPDLLHYADLLSGAVQVDTSVPDEWGPLNAPNVSDAVKEHYRRAFEPFAAYLERSFPLVHQRLKKEVVDGHGLIFTWQGSDEQLKPLVLMAHQDVVPVEPATAKDWKYPPFSGWVDREREVVWGRGATDDKASLITILASLEHLLTPEVPFQPSRTIVASFGFDEESTGSAAAALASFLVDRYGHDGAEMILDEGMSVVGSETPASEGGYGTPVAAPATSEKGYVDVRLVVTTPGGHSSVPPKNTGIGLLSRIVAAIEDHAPKPRLDRIDHPSLASLLCMREAPAIRSRRRLHRALTQLVKYAAPKKATSGSRKGRRHPPQRLFDDVLSSLQDEEIVAFQTTQAVDLIQGGVKINALPERSEATINYRIDVESGVDAVKKHLSALVERESRKLGLAFIGWVGDSRGEATSQDHGRSCAGCLHCTGSSLASRGKVHLEVAFNSALESAPQTPVTGAEAGPWRLLSSVIRSTWPGNTEKKDSAPASISKGNGNDVPITVVPSTMIGNTDTKSYWSLSRHIFRFAPGTLEPSKVGAGGNGIHTVDENTQIVGLGDAVRFYTALVLAVQDSK
ncbi:unnamed protein product [Jaminaea pallidilutea]